MGNTVVAENIFQVVVYKTLLKHSIQANILSTCHPILSRRGSTRTALEVVYCFWLNRYLTGHGFYNPVSPTSDKLLEYLYVTHPHSATRDIVHRVTHSFAPRIKVCERNP